ncbi:Fe(3+)-hydroxamate ABC transporter permease FhuB [Phytohalomonas tamaricis]|uniref:Fe(3+)-hydroxamate ABC transporter permease FhuB n=1 Tax=Phytohalomonas tamaricis TaxID=2081032 RepID=UPI000D0AD6C7|nr:Fe(3+)-hydroxamate ABC transporter permease FhuB [Phytohalomonas tamaricis]
MNRAPLITPARLCLALLLAGLILAWQTINAQLPFNYTRWIGMIFAPHGDDIQQIVVHYAILPRLCVALLCGGALALAGTLMQQVLRNPLASPTTLGVASGAQFALVVASLWAPGLLSMGREWVALAGGSAATAVVFALAWKRHLAPMVIVLAGLVVSLYLSALNTSLMLFHQETLRGLFIWGSGALEQDSWQDTLFLAPRLGIAAVLAWLLVRPMAVLDLDDDNARSLGVSLRKLRIASLGLAVFITACVVSAVGMIGFIGLAAPAIVRILGARRLGARLIWSTLLGALLLLVTDLTVQYFSVGAVTLLPTGAMTAALGAPLLLWLLPRLKIGVDRPRSSVGITLPRHAAQGRVLVILLILLIAIGAVALCLGRESPSQGFGGWRWLVPPQLNDMLVWRAPRVFTAAGAGLMLALAGTLLQRITGNPMASPEVLGISAGAAIGVIAVIMLAPLAGPLFTLIAGSVGALSTLSLLLLLNHRSGFLPERLLLTGIAITALFDALQGIVLAGGDPRGQQLLAWMSGSTYYADSATALWIVFLGVILLIATLPFSRWLTLLPLGAQTAQALGLNVTRSRLVLLMLMTLLTVSATLVIGPLSFIGLLAPHMARLMGLSNARMQLLGAGLLGALVMVLADWLGRTLLFPNQIPAGLVASLIGGLYFMWGLRRL